MKFLLTIFFLFPTLSIASEEVRFFYGARGMVCIEDQPCQQYTATLGDLGVALEENTTNGKIYGVA